MKFKFRQPTGSITRIPSSTMVYPETLIDRLKYFFWKAYTPYHTFFRDFALTTRLIRHEGRQDFVLGTIAPGVTLEDFVDHLVSHGFKNHFVAWRDTDEIASLRLVENFTFQYHIRIFQDGEVRGHYEYTPECRPILHLRKHGQEERREYFKDLLGNRII